MGREARLAEEFAAALEGRGTSGALRDPALAPLLSLAQGLQTLPVGPAPAFRDALRTRLLAVAAVSAPAPVPTPWERLQEWLASWRMQRLVGATAGAMASVVAVAGVSAAASRSLPGDPFYGVKRSAEAVQVGLARNSVNEGKRHLQHAETRLQEVSALVGTEVALGAGRGAGLRPAVLALGGSKAQHVIDALDAMDTDTQAGTKLLTDAFQHGHSPEPLRALTSFAVRQQAGLRQVISSVPVPAKPAAQDSLDLVAEVVQQTQDLLVVTPPPCTTDCGGPSTQPTDSPSPTPTVASSPTPSPTPGTPAPCDPCGTPSPEPTSSSSEAPSPEPSPSPSDSPSPDPSPSPSPSPSPTPSGVLPTVIPGPVRSPAEEVIDTLRKIVPTPSSS